MPDRITLNTGSAWWLDGLWALTALAAFTLLLAAPSPPAWRLAAVAALAVFLLFERHRSKRRNGNGTLQLRLDGNLQFTAGDSSVSGLLDGGSWTGSHFCMLHWTPLDGGRRHHSLVCASRNRADDYRRLLVWTRLGAFDDRKTAP